MGGRPTDGDSRASTGIRFLAPIRCLGFPIPRSEQLKKAEEFLNIALT